MTPNKSFQVRLKEAKICIEQGILDNAKDILLDLQKRLENDTSKDKSLISLKKEVERLLKKIEEKDEDSPKIKKIIKEGNLNEIYERALVFTELGIYEDALKDYKYLILSNFKTVELIPKVINCFQRLGKKVEVVKFFDEVLKNDEVKEVYKDVIRLEVAKILEKIGIYSKAYDYYKNIKNQKVLESIQDKLRLLASKIKGGSKYSYILETFISKDDLQAAIKKANKEGKSVEYTLIHDFKIPKEEVGKSLALFYDCEFFEFKKNYSPPLELIHNLKKDYLLNNVWFPLLKKKNKVIVVIDEPDDFSRTDTIKAILASYDESFKIEFAVAIKEDIIDFVNFYLGDKTDHLKVEFKEAEIDLEDLVDGVEEDVEYTEEEEDVFLSESDSKVVRFVNRIILDAHKRKASDIHIEPSPGKKKTIIRFRIDGVCQKYLEVPNSFAKPVVSRIKIMSNLDIAERRLPQDGKIKFKQKGKTILELRVATLPTVGGYEDVVLRLLHAGKPLALPELGMTEENMENFKKLIIQPYGLILVVGPTGSGKTTTLHSALSYINTPDRKIWTAEDPVEITQEGLRQVEVKPKIGLTFARVLRAFLRADPDVIMIGEMRDEETASTGIEASLTGHLVFSTLHTNSAPETVTRLLEMGLDPHNFADSLLGVLAQRLLRRLCPKCKEGYHPSKEEFEEFVDEYGREQFLKLGINYDEDLIFYRPVGCDDCGNTGYKGRVGIHELLVNNNKIQELIKKKAPTEDIRKIALEEGMNTLKQDGMLKCLQGITDIKEVRRVCIK